MHPLYSPDMYERPFPYSPDMYGRCILSTPLTCMNVPFTLKYSGMNFSFVIFVCQTNMKYFSLFSFFFDVSRNSSRRRAKTTLFPT